MRLLFISNFYPPADLGGWEQFCQEIADTFIDRGHEVHILTSRYMRSEIKKQPHVSRELFLESAVDYYRPIQDFLGLFFRSRYNKRKVQGLISDFRPDGVIIWGMMQISPSLAVKVEGLCNGKVGYYLCGYWPIERGPHESYWSNPSDNDVFATLSKPVAKVAGWQTRRNRLMKPAFQNTTAVSQEVINILRRNGVELTDSRVIYGGIHLDDFFVDRSRRGSDSSNPRKFIYVGTLSKNKGVDTLMEALVLVSKKYSPSHFNLTVIGSGHEVFNKWLSRFIDDNGLSNYVHLKGWLERKEISQYLDQSDAFIFPSVWEEPLARAMMEGMASGLTLISTTTGGSKEFLKDEENALTFSAGRAEELASKIICIIEDPEMASSVALEGQRTALTHFDIERMADELEEFSREIAAM